MPTALTGTFSGRQGSVRGGNWKVTFVLLGETRSSGQRCEGCDDWCDAYHTINTSIIAVNLSTGAAEEHAASYQSGPHDGAPVGRLSKVTLSDGATLSFITNGLGSAYVPICAVGAYVQELSVQTTTWTLTLDDITASDISDSAAALSPISGLPASFFVSNSATIASDLAAAGVTFSSFRAGDPGALQAFINVLPPSAATFKSNLSIPLALALGVSSDAVNMVADIIAANLQAAYIRTRDALSDAGVEATLSALGSMPDYLKPAPATLSKPPGCVGLGYVWSTLRNRCFQDDAELQAVEGPGVGGPPVLDDGEPPIETPSTESDLVKQVLVVSAHSIASAIGSTPALVIASAGTIAARLVAMGYTAQDLQTDPRATTATYEVAAEVVGGGGEFPTVPVVIGLAGAGVLALVLLRKRRG